ncbi:MAG: YihY/virulence factor BrkB family protein [Bacteroidetes bacterium QH_7_62_13]|nr:MAG: YihY/virulence factor BrkB family protein [Bacteroidetes bacterium QH_7_62_13]
MARGIDAFIPSRTALAESVQYYLRGLYRELSAKNVFLWAQAIAFKVLVTTVPIVILATGIVGRILQGNDAFTTVERFIRGLLPPTQSNELVSFLGQVESASGTIVGVGGIGLFLSAMSLFITLRIAVSNAFEQNWHEERPLLRGYLFDVRMVLQVGFLFLLTVGISVFLPSFFNNVIVQDLGGNVRWLKWLWNQSLYLTGLLLPFLITTAMFFQLYYLVPQPSPRKRSALSGALIAGVLWEITKQAFTYYATYVGQFDQYSTGTEGLSALGNTFGLLVAFVFWVYFSSVVLMIGAVISSLHEHKHVTAGHLPGEEPPPKALPVTDTPPTGPSPAHDPPDPSEQESVPDEAEEEAQPDPSPSP